MHNMFKNLNLFNTQVKRTNSLTNFGGDSLSPTVNPLVSPKAKDLSKEQKKEEIKKVQSINPALEQFKNIIMKNCATIKMHSNQYEILIKDNQDRVVLTFLSSNKIELKGKISTKEYNITANFETNESGIFIIKPEEDTLSIQGTLKIYEHDKQHFKGRYIEFSFTTETERHKVIFGKLRPVYNTLDVNLLEMLFCKYSDIEQLQMSPEISDYINTIGMTQIIHEEKLINKVIEQLLEPYFTKIADSLLFKQNESELGDTKKNLVQVDNDIVLKVQDIEEIYGLYSKYLFICTKKEITFLENRWITRSLQQPCIDEPLPGHYEKPHIIKLSPELQKKYTEIYTEEFTYVNTIISEFLKIKESLNDDQKKKLGRFWYYNTKYLVAAPQDLSLAALKEYILYKESVLYGSQLYNTIYREIVDNKDFKINKDIDLIGNRRQDVKIYTTLQIRLNDVFGMIINGPKVYLTYGSLNDLQKYEVINNWNKNVLISQGIINLRILVVDEKQVNILDVLDTKATISSTVLDEKIATFLNSLSFKEKFISPNRKIVSRGHYRSIDSKETTKDDKSFDLYTLDNETLETIINKSNCAFLKVDNTYGKKFLENIVNLIAAHKKTPDEQEHSMLDKSSKRKSKRNSRKIKATSMSHNVQNVVNTKDGNDSEKFYNNILLSICNTHYLYLIVSQLLLLIGCIKAIFAAYEEQKIKAAKVTIDLSDRPMDIKPINENGTISLHIDLRKEYVIKYTLIGIESLKPQTIGVHWKHLLVELEEQLKRDGKNNILEYTSEELLKIAVPIIDYVRNDALKKFKSDITDRPHQDWFESFNSRIIKMRDIFKFPVTINKISTETSKLNRLQIVATEEDIDRIRGPIFYWEQLIQSHPSMVSTFYSYLDNKMRKGGYLHDQTLYKMQNFHAALDSSDFKEILVGVLENIKSLVEIKETKDIKEKLTMGLK